MTDFNTNEAFQKMNPEKQQIVRLLADSLQGKKLTEALPLLVHWKKEMQKKNISFSKEENELLTSLFTEQMTPAQKKQYEYLKPFIS